MRIEFDPTNRDEATAVRAVLAALHPEESRAKANGDGSFSVEYRRDLNDGSVVFTSATDGVTTLEETAVPTRTDEETVPEVDRDGSPHDPRIHSTPAKTNADGTWRAKRGVTADVIAAVRAEREAAVAAQDPEMDDYATDVIEPAQEQSAPPAPNAPSPAPKPPGQSEAPLAPAVSIATEPDSSTTSTGSVSESAAVAPSFLDVMKAITAAQKDGKIDTAKVKELCAAVGAGESTMGLNGPDNGDKRVAFMALLAEETK